MKAPTDGTAAAVVSPPRSERKPRTTAKPTAAATATHESTTHESQASAAPASKPPPENRTTVTKAKTAAADKPAPAAKAAAKPEAAAPATAPDAKAADAKAASVKVTAMASAIPDAPPPAVEAQVEVQVAPLSVTPPSGAAPPVAAPAAEPPRPAPPRHADMRPGQPHMQNGRPVPPSRAAAKEEIFVEGDFVVYPTHGVGKVEKIAVEDIAGHRLDLIHITFEENRMTLRVPVAKARTAGLRKLATRKMFDEALAVLKGRARIKRTMWSRRAQEYEAKINSGDPIAIAEVVRDLHRNSGQPDQSFSERQIYEAAMDRLAAELGALDETDKMTATIKLINFLKAA